MFNKLLRRSAPREEGMAQTDKIKFILRQAYDFEVALQAMDYVLDDRSDEGLQLLLDNENNEGVNHGDEKTINYLARGVIEFLEAVLGFEAAEMKKASATLAKAEELSLKSRQKAQKLNIKSSSLYPPGTVYAVTYTEACLLHALLMLFSESMMEAAKALLKLRKAYHMLVEIFQATKKAEETKSANPSRSASQASFFSGKGNFESVDIPYKLSPEEQDNPQLLAHAERVHSMRIKRLTGAHIGNSPAINRLRHDMGLDAMKHLPKVPITEFSPLTDDLDMSEATIDEFIGSGVNLCYGILQVVLSLIPPAIGAVLSIVGFKGNREDGLRLIWKSTKTRNIHGCIGLLGLMFYYDGPFQFTDADFDIPAHGEVPVSSMSGLSLHEGSTVGQSNLSLPSEIKIRSRSSSKVRSGSNSQANSKPVSRSSSHHSLSTAFTASSRAHSKSVRVDEMDGHTLLHPGRLLIDALLQARALFPNSALWLLNEATILSANGRLLEAVELLDSIDVDKIQMRQVKSRLIFDRAITLVHLHEYDRAAADLIALIDISNWSHALYRYFAGCCYLENYRLYELGIRELENPEKYRKQAEEWIFTAPELLGKRKFKSKYLPLDRFMLRKVEYFKATQKRLNLENPLDAIATSPAHELTYFYNGYNRMDSNDLKLARTLLTEYHNPATDERDPDQELIRKFLVSLTDRRLGHVQEGCDLMDNEILPAFFYMENDVPKFIKKNEDPWLYPAALYERALFNWKLTGMAGLQESREWLTRAQNYSGDYELSTRIGMKIKAASDRVDSAL